MDLTQKKGIKMKIKIEIEKEILNLNQQKCTKDEIAELLHISRRSVFNILKKYKVPKEYQQKNKKITSINEVISIHLLKNCDDIELLSKMFASTICYQKVKNVTVPERVSKVVGINKIKKIVSVAELAGLDFSVEYGIRKFA